MSKRRRQRLLKLSKQLRPSFWSTFWRSKFTDWLSAISTGELAFVTFLLVIVTSILAYYTYQLFNKAYEQAQLTKDAINIADSQFTHQKDQDKKANKREWTRDSIQNIKDSLTLVNNKLVTRAYIGVDEPKKDTLYESTFAVSTYIRNKGQSIANCVFADASIAPVKNNSKKELEKLKIEYDYYKVEVEKHKNEGFSLTPDLGFPIVFYYHPEKSSTEFIERVNNTLKLDYMYLIGRLVYKDIFGDEHYVSFCFQYHSDVGRFLLHSNFNEAN
jgi:hypothetical protein